MPFDAECSAHLAPLAIAVALTVTPAAAADFAGLVDIGGGRTMYLECSGTGAPTVMLISGNGNGTKSRHNVHAFAPQLAIDAIRDVVESVRAREATP